MILVVDNSQSDGRMTSILISFLKNYSKVKVIKPADIFSINESELQGVVLSGGPRCLSEDNSLEDFVNNIKCFNYKVPILCICFGFQLLSQVCGSTIIKLPQSDKRIDEIETLHISKYCPLFEGLGNTIQVFESHQDGVKCCPIGFDITIQNPNGCIEGIVKDNIFGVQFHPEGTEDGRKIIHNFVTICRQK